MYGAATDLEDQTAKKETSGKRLGLLAVGLLLIGVVLLVGSLLSTARTGPTNLAIDLPDCTDNACKIELGNGG